MSGGTGRRTISREMAADTLVIEVVVRVGVTEAATMQVAVTAVAVAVAYTCPPGARVHFSARERIYHTRAIRYYTYCYYTYCY